MRISMRQRLVNLIQLRVVGRARIDRKNKNRPITLLSIDDKVIGRTLILLETMLLNTYPHFNLTIVN